MNRDGTAPPDAPVVHVLVIAVATVLLFMTLRTSLALERRESYALLAAYGLFVAWVVAETVGATGRFKWIYPW